VISLAVASLLTLSYLAGWSLQILQFHHVPVATETAMDRNGVGSRKAVVGVLGTEEDNGDLMGLGTEHLRGNQHLQGRGGKGG